MSDHAPVHALWDAECAGAHTRATFRTVGGRRLFFDGVGWRGVCPQATDTARRAAGCSTARKSSMAHGEKALLWSPRSDGEAGRLALRRAPGTRPHTLPSVIKGCRKRRRVRTGGAVDAQQQSKRSRRLPVVTGNKALDWTGVLDWTGETYTPHAARILHSSGSTPLISMRTPSHTA
jgi:hypothetical protein